MLEFGDFNILKEKPVSWNLCYEMIPGETGHIISTSLKLNSDQIKLLQILRAVMPQYQASRSNDVTRFSRILSALCVYVPSFVELFCEPELNEFIDYINENYALFKNELHKYLKKLSQGDELMKKSYFIICELPSYQQVCIHIQGYMEKNKLTQWLLYEGAKDIHICDDDEMYEEITSDFNLLIIDRSTHPSLYREVIDEIINPNGKTIWIPTKSPRITQDNVKQVKLLLAKDGYTQDEVGRICGFSQAIVSRINKGEYDGCNI